MANQDVIIQLLNERFGDLMRRLDVMDAKNDQRDLRVNTMDKENKAEITAVRTEIDKAKTLWKAACWVGAVIASVIGWAASAAPKLLETLHRG